MATDQSYPWIMIKATLRLFLMVVMVFLLAGSLSYWQGRFFSGAMITR